MEHKMFKPSLWDCISMDALQDTLYSILKYKNMWVSIKCVFTDRNKSINLEYEKTMLLISVWWENSDYIYYTIKDNFEDLFK